MPLNCDLDALLLEAACFLNGCVSQSEREAIEIYLKAQALVELGGANYTDPTVLQEAAKEWQAVRGDQLDAIEAVITKQNAVDNGVTADVDIDSLKEASACFQCLGTERKRQLLMFLKCAINDQGAPD